MRSVKDEETTYAALFRDFSINLFERRRKKLLPHLLCTGLTAEVKRSIIKACLPSRPHPGSILLIMVAAVYTTFLALPGPWEGTCEGREVVDLRISISFGKTAVIGAGLPPFIISLGPFRGESAISSPSGPPVHQHHHPLPGPVPRRRRRQHQ